MATRSSRDRLRRARDNKALSSVTTGHHGPASRLTSQSGRPGTTPAAGGDATATPFEATTVAAGVGGTQSHSRHDAASAAAAEASLRQPDALRGLRQTARVASSRHQACGSPPPPQPHSTQRHSHRTPQPKPQPHAPTPANVAVLVRSRVLSPLSDPPHAGGAVSGYTTHDRPFSRPPLSPRPQVAKRGWGAV